MTVQLPTSTPQQTAPKLTMSLADYESWAYQQEARTEWVNGNVEFKVSVSTIHQDVIYFLIELLRMYVRLMNLGRVSGGPVQARINDYSMREPDIFFVANEQVAHLTEKRLECPPQLIIEIVSEGSVKLDRQIKFREYRSAGVQEYWIIDPRSGKNRADFYQLVDGEYELSGTEDDERYASTTLNGFWMKPAWLWDTNSISALLKIAEITGLSFNEIGKRLEATS